MDTDLIEIDSGMTSRAARQRHVLVVDDDAVDRERVANYLALNDFRVTPISVTSVTTSSEVARPSGARSAPLLWLTAGSRRHGVVSDSGCNGRMNWIAAP